MDSKRKLFNLGSGILALFVVGLLLGATFTTAWAEPTPRAPMFIEDGAKDVSGDFVWTNSGYIAPGSSGTWTFWVWSDSWSDEAIDTVKLDFPAGITVTGATNCVVEPWFDRYLEYDGTTGDDAEVTWFDPNGGAGEIGNYEFGIVTVDVTVGGGFSGDVVVAWYISGDGTGVPPNDVSGTVTIFETTPLVVDNHVPYYVTGDFTNVLVMHFTLTDPVADDWLN
ncbi:hypothetical protein KAX22_05690, partial [bacterium]|nr:hypothetical protein [bacterium]